MRRRIQIPPREPNHGNSAATLRELKGVRNEVAHDYAANRLPEIFAQCRSRKTELDAICARTEDYARKL